MATRALHGVNLAGWLTLEPWVTPEPFANSGALDEPSLMAAVGATRYRELVEEHRRTFMEAADFKRIAARGFNAVRLPVPWYVMGDAGPGPGGGVGCVEHVDHAFDWAEEIGLKLVLALAVSPGRRDAEGALVRSGTSLRDNRGTLLEVVGALSGRYAHRVGFSGIELLDVPRARRRAGLGLTNGVPMHMLRTYYREAYDVVRAAAGEDVVVIMPDGGAPGSWRAFMRQSRYRNVWLSCQLFHNADHTSASGPSGVRRLVAESRASLGAARTSGLPVSVSAWSGALPYADSLMTPEGRIALERIYLSEQLAAFKDCPAWFFQAWKTSARLTGWDARVSLATFERRMLD